jgi:hypothetical protein
MSDAPERIALIPSDGWSWTKWPINHQEDAIEYVRADLAALPPAPDALEALVKAEHTRLSMTPAQFANMERWRGYTEGLDAMRDAALAAIRAGGKP